MNIYLEGDLTFMPLPDLLQWIEQVRKSCILSVTGIDDASATRSFYFENGQIIFCSSDHAQERFGEYLTRVGQLEAGAMKTALLESRKLGVCFTQYLIDSRLATLETLTNSLAGLAETILVGVIGSGKGRFMVGGPIPGLIRGGPVRLGSGHLILDSLRKLDEADRYGKAVGSDVSFDSGPGTPAGP